MSSFRNSLLSSVGMSAVVEIGNILHPEDGRIFCKLESLNPGGSIKDRPALYIIEEAERRGLLKPGGTIIESSSGNFGISLAMIGAAKNYRVIVLVDPKTTDTNLGLMEAFGAEVIVVTEQDDTGSYHKTRIALANRFHREIPNSFRPDQVFNLDNHLAHYKTTAPELLAARPQGWDYVVAAVSTGGQIGGLAKFFAEHAPKTKIVAVDAVGSGVFGGETKPYLTPGVGLGWTPENIRNMSLLDSIYQIEDRHSFAMARLLARHEGLMVGVSTGMCAFVALGLAIRNSGASIALMAADRGERYLSTLFNRDWLAQKGLLPDPTVAEMRARAAATVPDSTYPPERANYQPELFEELGGVRRSEPQQRYSVEDSALEAHP